MNEDLNIEKAVAQLLVKALNKFRHKKEAASALGISEPTMYTIINSHGIKQVNNKWIKQ